jgi:hypothetical protein
MLKGYTIRLIGRSRNHTLHITTNTDAKLAGPIIPISQTLQHTRIRTIIFASMVLGTGQRVKKQSMMVRIRMMKGASRPNPLPRNSVQGTENV